MTFNQQQKPVFNKLQILGFASAIALIGGTGISITKAIGSKAEQLPVVEQTLTPQITAPTLQPQPTQPPSTTQTQIIILTPNNETELDCLKFGGGLGCFDRSYQPQTPVHWASEKEEQPKQGEPRNVGIYKFW